MKNIELFNQSVGNVDVSSDSLLWILCKGCHNSLENLILSENCAVPRPADNIDNNSVTGET